LQGVALLPQIVLKGICKYFKVRERPEGRFSVIRGAFVRNTRIVKALDDISFSIDQGELVGYIGPNGAGKSTTVKIMSGILTPDKGECVIMGRIPWKQRIAHVARIGVVFGQRSQLWWDVPVSDSFDLLKDMYSIPAGDYAKRHKELVEALDIGSLLKTPVRQLSLGQRMRCELAAALLHSPDILFLDEPTIGLDAVSKLALREFLKRKNKEHGVTMILTTHDMDDIESLCSRVMVIGRGKLLYDGCLSELKRQYAPLHCISATLEGDATLDSMTHGVEVEGAVDIRAEGNVIKLFFDPSVTPAHVMVQRLAGRLPLKDIVIEEQDIDEIIAAMYREMCL